MADVVLPQLGESVVEGTVTRWLKAVGDDVVADEPLFEVSTDKVDSEVPANATGILSEILAGEGDTVAVGQTVAVISEGSSLPEHDEKRRVTDSSGSVIEISQTERSRLHAATGAESDGEAAQGRESREGHREPLSHFTSPIVRRIAREAGVNMDSVEGTGPEGRITRSDVEAHAKKVNGAGAVPSQKLGRRSSREETEGAHLEAQEFAEKAVEDEKFVPFNRVRQRTAEHMVASLSTSPHAVTAVEVFYDNVEKTRTRHKKQFKEQEGFSLTYLPFIARATIDALAEFPHLNASVRGDGLVVHRHVHLSIAVDLNFDGLVAPVVKNAEEFRLLGLARSINDLASRARNKKLSPGELSGGTFTLSNSGSYGTHMVIPIINQPQVGIISTDGVTRKPAVMVDDRGGEAIAVRSVGVLAMSWDHRAFDGAYAAAFMAKIKEILESRNWEDEL